MLESQSMVRFICGRLICKYVRDFLQSAKFYYGNNPDELDFLESSGWFERQFFVSGKNSHEVCKQLFSRLKECGCA